MIWDYRDVIFIDEIFFSLVKQFNFSAEITRVGQERANRRLVGAYTSALYDLS